MIGGRDIYVPVAAGAPAMDYAIRAIRLFWPAAVFEDANSSAHAAEYAKLDFSSLSEVFAYKSAADAKAWDLLGADPCLDGTMIHLLISRQHFTMVVDDHPSPEIQLMIDAITTGLKRSERRINWKEAA